MRDLRPHGVNYSMRLIAIRSWQVGQEYGGLSKQPSLPPDRQVIDQGGDERQCGQPISRRTAARLFQLHRLFPRLLPRRTPLRS
jgi:hypothetical protein